MAALEIADYLLARSADFVDSSPVSLASLDDLEQTSLDQFLAQVRSARPSLNLSNRSREQLLHLLRIVVPDENGIMRPTLAGLLMFGGYPQQFYPQLTITFLQYFGVDDATPSPTGARFVDN